MRETVHSIQQMQRQDKGCGCNCDDDDLLDLTSDYPASEKEFVNCYCTLCGPKGRDSESHCRNRVLRWLAEAINGSHICFSCKRGTHTCMSCADDTGVIAPVSEMSQTIQQMQPSSSSSGQMPQRDSAMSSSPAGFVLVPPAIGIPGNTKEAAAERLKEFLRGVRSDTSIPHTHTQREGNSVRILYARGKCNAGTKSWTYFKRRYAGSFTTWPTGCETWVECTGK